jgi:hypothetical protein
MSLRDWFAGQALCGLLAFHSMTAADAAKEAYRCSEAMISRRRAK